MKEQEKKEEREERLYCEKYQEWVPVIKGCMHLKDYCQYRKHCLLYIKAKFKEF